MELFLVIAVSVNILLSFLILTRKPSEVVKYFEFELVDYEPKQEEIKEPDIQEDPVPAKIFDESHKAWKNRKEEPILATPSPHKPPPIPGPLERPSGFAS